MRKLLFLLGFLVLVFTEFIRVYLIMPFPGSQESSAIEWSYFFHQNTWWIRLIGLACLIPFFYKEFVPSKWYTKLIFGLLFGAYGFVFYVCWYEFPATSMFKPITQTQLVNTKYNKVPLHKLVIGVHYKNEARAYPIEIIGYHHQVSDQIAQQTIMVTYCTVCRTGRVYLPHVKGKKETFNLVGMDVFNAMFEDQTTGSWWQQATGICIAGPLKGQQLPELNAQQMTLSEWIQLHPSTTILQEDKTFANDYAYLKDYDEGTINNSLEGTNFNSWENKSWVVGVLLKKKNIAVDWNFLTEKKIVQDKNFVLFMLNDKKSFLAYDNNRHLFFEWNAQTEQLTDTNTHSKWNIKGVCYEGEMAGSFLNPIPAYQEFWHSWQTFHPGSELIGKK